MIQIDFKLIASAALARAKVLLPQWLPGGDWAGDEYKALNQRVLMGAKVLFQSMLKRAFGLILRLVNRAVI